MQGGAPRADSTPFLARGLSPLRLLLRRGPRLRLRLRLRRFSGAPRSGSAPFLPRCSSAPPVSRALGRPRCFVVHSKVGFDGDVALTADGAELAADVVANVALGGAVGARSGSAVGAAVAAAAPVLLDGAMLVDTAFFAPS